MDGQSVLDKLYPNGTSVSTHKLRENLKWLNQLRLQTVESFLLLLIILSVIGLVELTGQLLLSLAGVGLFYFLLNLIVSRSVRGALNGMVLVGLFTDLGYAVFLSITLESQFLLLLMVLAVIIAHSQLFTQGLALLAWLSGLIFIAINELLLFDPAFSIKPLTDYDEFSVIKSALTIIAFGYVSYLLRKQMTKEEKSTAQDDMVSLASHQLRTPATAVKDLLSVIIDGYVGDISPDQENYLKRAFEENERQIRLIEMMLNVAKIGNEKLKLDSDLTNLSQLVSELVTEYTGKVQAAGQSIKLNIPTQPVWLMVDPEKFRMVVDNLISNANKYTPQGGAISVTLAKKGKKTIISVSDTGIGIDKHDQQQLFQKYSRLDHSDLGSTVSGSGLGLYLARQIVQMHGGTLNVHSSPGAGSIFTITI